MREVCYGVFTLLIDSVEELDDALVPDDVLEVDWLLVLSLAEEACVVGSVELSADAVEPDSLSSSVGACDDEQLSAPLKHAPTSQIEEAFILE